MHAVLLGGANTEHAIQNACDDKLLNSEFSHLLVQNEIPWTCTLHALQVAHHRGAKTFFNPSPMPSAEQLRSFPWEAVNWLIMNEGEVDGLFAALDPSGDLDRAGIVIPSTWPQDPILSRAHELLHALRCLPDFPNSVNLVCTLGSLGVLTLPASLHEDGERNDAIYVPATRLENPVIDTTGAGDCFTGYFVAGCMRHWAENEGSEPGTNELERIVKLAVQVRYSIVRWCHYLVCNSLYRLQEYASPGPVRPRAHHGGMS